jgi:predicted RND superfamily exporter protein
MVLFHVSDYVNRRWGRFIATYPWTHILLSLLCCVIMSAQLWNMEMEHDIRASFSPANSRFTHESAVYREFFNLSVLPQRAFIMFSAKDHGSILRVEQLKEVFKLDDYFTSVLRKRDNATGMRGCDPICETNKPFRKVAEKLISSYENASQTDDFIFDYPTATYKGINLFIGMNMIGTRRSG